MFHNASGIAVAVFVEPCAVHWPWSLPIVRLTTSTVPPSTVTLAALQANHLLLLTDDVDIFHRTQKLNKHISRPRFLES